MKKDFIDWLQYRAPDWVPVFFILLAGLLVCIYLSAALVALVEGWLLIAGLMLMLPLYFAIRRALTLYRKDREGRDI